MGIWCTKINILWWDQFPSYGSMSQIGFKSSLNASNISQIHRWSRKTIATIFSCSILGEKKSTRWLPVISGVKLGHLALEASYGNGNHFGEVLEVFTLFLCFLHNSTPFPIVYRIYVAFALLCYCAHHYNHSRPANLLRLWGNSTHTNRIWIKFDLCEFKFQVSDHLPCSWSSRTGTWISILPDTN